MTVQYMQNNKVRTLYVRLEKVSSLIQLLLSLKHPIVDVREGGK